jgi:hypothetical protein
MSKIEIIPFEPKHKRIWEKFIAKSNNGTMFHRLAFMDYHNEGKFDFSHLTFWKDGEMIAVLPGGFKEEGKAYWSPVGASYGSLVTKDIAFDLSSELVDTMLEYFASRGTKEIFLIPPPLIYNKVYNQNVEYSMLYRKFDFEYHYISHAVDLKLHHSRFQNYDHKTAKTIEKIRKEKNITVRETKDYDAFYPILLDNKAKHNTTPTHSLADLHRLEELVPDNLKLFLVYKDETPIAGSLLFLPNPKVSLCFYVMMDYNYKSLRPNFLALDESIRWSMANGYDWFDIGVSQDTSSENPMTPSNSLIYFKERFGARGIFRSTYHYKFD